MSEITPQKKIEEFNLKIKRIVSDIEVEVANQLTRQWGDSDFFTAFQYAKEIWPQQVHVPVSKEEAIRILDNPKSEKLDKLGALLFAEMYKKGKLEKAHKIKPETGNGITFYTLDSD